MSVIDEYILGFSEEKQKIMEEMRSIILKNAPDATEKISWGMPTFYLNGNLVHFAMNKNHLGFYPTPSGIASFEARLAEYKHSKGAVQFLLNKPLPEELIADIVKLRVAENLKR